MIEAPVEEAQLPESIADVVTSFEVIEHLFSPRGVHRPLRERSCGAGGLLIVTCPNVKGFDMEILGEASGERVDAEHLNYFIPRSLAACWSGGFEVLEAHTPGRLDAELVRKKALAGEWDSSVHRRSCAMS